MIAASTFIALSGLWLGLVIVLDQAPWFRGRSLARRLAPFLPGWDAADTGDRSSVPTRVLGPVVERALDAVRQGIGTNTDLRRRLLRAGRVDTAAAFRTRQFGHALAGACAGGVIAVASGAAGLAACGWVAAPAIAWAIVDEQRLGRAIAGRHERLRLELPVVAEQLGILVTAGYSLPAAVQRIADRGHGLAAEDLARVGRRLRQGLTDTAALSEWEERSGLDTVGRLGRVLAMHRDAGDLGSLISAEARSMRADTHRHLVETIERRSQLVWVPVTVATLVPGLLLLGIPFISALRQVTG